MDSLWRSGGLEVRRAPAGQGRFIQQLNAEQAQVLEADDIPMLWQLALSMREEARSLLPSADSIFDRLWRHLREHPDMRVREALARNPHVPPDYAFSVSERFRQDLPFCTTAFSRLQQSDLGMLFKSAHTLLLQLSREIGGIENPSVRKNVIRYLARHPDPLVRHALAGHGGIGLRLSEDRQLFHTVLMDLSEDPDLRVCAAVRTCSIGTLLFPCDMRRGMGQRPWAAGQTHNGWRLPACLPSHRLSSPYNDAARPGRSGATTG